MHKYIWPVFKCNVTCKKHWLLVKPNPASMSSTACTIHIHNTIPTHSTLITDSFAWAALIIRDIQQGWLECERVVQPHIHICLILNSFIYAYGEILWYYINVAAISKIWTVYPSDAVSYLFFFRVLCMLVWFLTCCL